MSYLMVDKRSIQYETIEWQIQKALIEAFNEKYGDALEVDLEGTYVHDFSDLGGIPAEGKISIRINIKQRSKLDYDKTPYNDDFFNSFKGKYILGKKNESAYNVANSEFISNKKPIYDYAIELFTIKELSGENVLIEHYIGMAYDDKSDLEALNFISQTKNRLGDKFYATCHIDFNDAFLFTDDPYHYSIVKREELYIYLTANVEN